MVNNNSGLSKSVIVEECMKLKSRGKKIAGLLIIMAVILCAGFFLSAVEGPKIIFEKESTWVGMRRYVHGKRSGKNNELILVLQRV